MFKPSIPVLMYHHVRPGAGMIASTPENFEDQLRWLKKEDYRSLTLDEFAQHLEDKDQGKAVVITFDDGYLDNWVYAFPLLQKYQMKATIFLVTSWLHHGPVRPVMGQDNVPNCPDHIKCEALINAGHSDEVILRWSEVDAMRQSGLIEFHSHTHTHTRWDLIPEENKNDRIQWELEQSRLPLQKELGEASRHLCWPQGYFDEDYIAIAQKNGFSHLYTTKAFGRNTRNTDNTHIHRFHVRNRPAKTLAKRIRGGHNPLLAPVFNNWKLFTRKLKKQ